MIVVGVTGNLHSGKSTVADTFRKLGARVFDADEAARRVLAPGKPAAKAVAKLFGKAVLDAKGRIDRKKLASYVFSRPAELKKLNTLVHPGVIVEGLSQIDLLKSRDGILVLDVPLLFESKMNNLCDFTVVVRDTAKRSVERASRRGIAPALAKRILANQWPIARKARLADHVIDNDGSPETLRARAREIFRKIRARSSSARGKY